GPSGGKTVWWGWTAPANGLVSIDTVGGGFATVLTVYSGSALANLQGADRNSHSYPRITSPVSFIPQAGVTYQIAVDGFVFPGASIGDSGRVVLNLSLGAAVSAPANDSFSQQIPIVGTFATITGSNQFATPEPGEPRHDGTGVGRSVWW